MHRNVKLSALVLGLIGATSSVQAAEDELGIYGFLSVGTAVLDNDLKNDINGDGSVNGDDGVDLDGFDDLSGNFRQDTVFGLQITKQLNDSISATGQLVSRGSENYDTESTWAFVTYSANRNLDIRMGRMRIPFFYYSEFLEVGYAYNWVRTPSDVYNLPFSSFDGIDISQKFSFAGIDGDIKINYGRFTDDFEVFGDEYSTDLTNIGGAALNLQKGNFGFRLSLQRTEITFDTEVDSDLQTAYEGLIAAQATGSDTTDALTAVAAASEGVRTLDAGQSFASAYATVTDDPDLAEEFDLDGKIVEFYDAAITYDNGSYGLVLEGAAIQYESGLIYDNLAWLVHGFKRFNDYTIHATYSTSKDVLDSGAVGDLQDAIGRQVEDISTILGLRYDYDAGTAIKFEVEHHDEKLRNATEGNSAMLYSIAVDVIF